MANSSLQGYTWNLPEKLHNHLQRIMNAYKGAKNVEGYQRLENILSNKKVSYENLKLIKNFFDTFGGSTNDTVYVLNGGTKMKGWVSDTLYKARESIKNPKDVKMKTGMSNQFQDTYTQDGVSTDSLKIKNKKVSSSSRKISDNKGIYEIKIMENIISIFDKNKQLWHTDK
jgi:hypothetical protein